MSFSSDPSQISNQLPQTITLPDIENKEEFSEKVEDLLKDIAQTATEKENGRYLLEEKGSSAMYFGKSDPNNLRNVYRKTFDLLDLSGGDIGASETVQYPHEISGIVESAGIFAHCASVDGVYFTSVFPDIRLTDTTIIFTNPYTQALTECTVVANILKEA